MSESLTVFGVKKKEPGRFVWSRNTFSSSQPRFALTSHRCPESFLIQCKSK